MALVAEYELRCARLPLVEVAAAVPSATIEVSMVPTAEGHTPFVVRVTEGPVESVEAEFSASAFVGELAVLGVNDGTHRYKIRPAQRMERWFDEEFDVAELRSLAAADATIDYITVTPTGWIQRGWFADGDTLDRFRTFWADHGGFILRYMHRAEKSVGGEGLTGPQRRAFQTAYEMGFFDIPRSASLDDVAAELDITASSLSERLRRAQAHLAETVVTVSPRRASE